MATHYIEFDSNSQNLLADLRVQILTSSDWSRLTPDPALLATSAATNANATSLPFVDTSASGLSVGSMIMIGDGATREYRAITAMTATTITVSAMTYAHAIGTSVRWGQEVYRCTTTRGADMVIDLTDSQFLVNSSQLSAAVYRSHDGLVGSGKSTRYLYWRTNAGAITHPLHVTLSISKEHFFLMIEGPRPGETGALDGTYGSLKNYIFLCDVVPYDAGDAVPVVFAGGSAMNTYNGAFTNFSHTGNVSASLDGESSWVTSRLATLEFPKVGFSDAFNVQRQRAIDNQYVLSPYVVFQDDSGMRGRLNSFFFAGFSQADTGSFEVPVPPIGTKVEYQGQWYKLLTVNKSDSSRHCWSQFGASTQSTGGTYSRSPVVAVPCLP